MSRCNRALFVSLAGLLLLAGLATPSVSAQTGATVDVTATIGLVPELQIYLCDSSAAFGEGLTDHGRTPTGADPGVHVTPEGSQPGEGVFYVWDHRVQCSVGLSVNSNVDFTFGWCATENDAVGASPDVTMTEEDLRIFIGPAPWPPLNPGDYNSWLGRHTLQRCDIYGSYPQPYAPGWWDINYELGLRVDDGDANGAFHSVLTFSVVPN